MDAPRPFPLGPADASTMIAAQVKPEPSNKAARGLAEFFGIPALMGTPAEQAAVAKRLRRRSRNLGIRG